MSKGSFFRLSTILVPHVQHKDTNYRKAIPALVKVACTIYKLTHGASLLFCSEQFAIGKATVCKAIREVVRGINIEFRRDIQFPRGQRLTRVMNEFRDFCGLPSVCGTIDGTHFQIQKPHIAPEDYFYFKTGGHSMYCQAVVDRNKKFIDLYVGMLGSVNNSRALKRSSLYRLARTTNLFDVSLSQEGFSLYLLGDKGYPLLSWLMTLHPNFLGGNRSDQERLYNRKMCRGRSVMENAFGILKQCFRELLQILELNVSFFPDVVIACAQLHNLLLGQSEEEVKLLLGILRREGMSDVENDAEFDVVDPIIAALQFDRAVQKRNALGIFLARQRNIDFDD